MAYDGKQRDLEWARAIKQGDHAAFEALFRTYAEKLCNFTDQYVKSPEVAEEIVQDLFLKIWQCRDQWNPRTNVRAYLYKTARNRGLDYLKHEQVVEEWKQQADVDPTAVSVSPDDTLRKQELHRAIHDAVAELPERQRLVFLLSRRHDMTYREVAETMEISIKTVETHMSRAFATLRKLLADHRSSVEKNT